MTTLPARRPRSRNDRRVNDHPLPHGMEDRRRLPERRLPIVSHQEFDEYISISAVAALDGDCLA